MPPRFSIPASINDAFAGTDQWVWALGPKPAPPEAPPERMELFHAGYVGYHSGMLRLAPCGSEADRRDWEAGYDAAFEDDKAEAAAEACHQVDDDFPEWEVN